jgi:ABC-type Fe3+-siderophore transport system permease subunit
MKNLFNKTSWKFLGIFAAIVTGSIVIAYMAVFFSPELKKQRVGEDYAKTLQE